MASKSILKKNKDDGASAEKKSASSVKFNGEPARQVKPRKRAADFLSDDEESEPEVDAKATKAQTEKKAANKKSKKEDGTAAPAAKTKTTNAKPLPKSKKPEAIADNNDDSAASESGEDEEEDDRTVALIKGFESSGDEDESGDEGYDPSKPVPKIPDSKKAKRKILKKQKDEKSGSGEEPGTVYVGYFPPDGLRLPCILCPLVLTFDALDVSLTVSTNMKCEHTFHNSVRLLVCVSRGTALPVVPNITLSWNSSRSPLPRSLPPLWITI